MRPDRLRTVLHLRELVERQRLAERAAADRQLAAAQRALADATLTRAGACITPGIHLVAGELSAAHLGGIALGDVVDRAELAVTTAGREAELATQRLVAAAIGRRSVERLSERRQGAADRADARRDARRADEVALQVWRRSS